MAGNDPGCSDVIPPAFVLLKALLRILSKKPPPED